MTNHWMGSLVLEGCFESDLAGPPGPPMWQRRLYYTSAESVVRLMAELERCFPADEQPGTYLDTAPVTMTAEEEHVVRVQQLLAQGWSLDELQAATELREEMDASVAEHRSVWEGDRPTS